MLKSEWLGSLQGDPDPVITKVHTKDTLRPKAEASPANKRNVVVLW